MSKNNYWCLVSDATISSLFTPCTLIKSHLYTFQFFHITCKVIITLKKEEKKYMAQNKYHWLSSEEPPIQTTYFIVSMKKKKRLCCYNIFFKTPFVCNAHFLNLREILKYWTTVFTCLLLPNKGQFNTESFVPQARNSLPKQQQNTGNNLNSHCVCEINVYMFK